MKMTNAVGGILTGINTRVDSIMTITKGILCLPQLLSPNGLMNLTSGILQTLNAFAGSIISGMLNYVTNTVTNIINNVVGTISSQINIIRNFIRDIHESITLIKTYSKYLVDKVTDIDNYLMDKQNCSFAAAELAKCLMFDAFDEMPKAITRSLYNDTNAINKKVVDITSQMLSPGKAVSRYINEAQSKATKAIYHQMF